MIFCKNELLTIVDVGIDSRLFLDLKKFNSYFTINLLSHVMGLNYGFRTVKRSLELLLNSDNKIIKIDKLIDIKDININTPFGISFKYNFIESEEAKDNQYCVIDDKELEFLRSAKLTSFEMLTYLALAIFRNSNSLICYPSQIVLANLLNSNQSNICRAVKGLEQKGVINVSKAKSNNHLEYNVYEFIKAIPLAVESVIEEKEVYYLF